MVLAVRLQVGRFARAMLPVVFVALLAAPCWAVSRPLADARQGYEDAVLAIDRGKWTEYQRLRSSLDDYPLAIYLDYFQLARQVHRVGPAEARDFVSRSGDTPLPNRFLSAYLERAGRDRRWRDFLAVMPREPNGTVLKCYYFRAQLAAGERQLAWDGAARLWVHGKSRPDQCDPLFAAWMDAGQLSDELVWARMLEAFAARQGSLLRYVARKGSAELQPWAERLQAVYRKPDRLRRQTLPADEPYSADVASHGLAYLARYNPQRALADWQHFSALLAFDPEQQRRVEYAIARQALLSREASLDAWLGGALQRLGDDKLLEIRLRWALAEQDWTALADGLALLSDEGRQQTAWRYWSAVVLEQQGEREQARVLFTALAGERGYYSFLAADRLGEAYAFNHQPLAPAEPSPLAALPAVRRIGELRFHEEANLAHSEWYKVLGDRPDPGEQQQLAQVAFTHGWHRMAIDAANRARAWDALDLRFPMPYQKTFQSHAAAQQVPSTELMAIARRESAFFPEARSPVGARGLMQIMPATGRQVASSLGRSHRNADLYEVEHNVLLGSAYYRQLLDRYSGNRVFALAAYNAGPHRVDRWRNKSGQSLPVDIWIETIPFRETRNYVQAVLAYNVVFQYMMGDTHRLLTPEERRARY